MKNIWWGRGKENEGKRERVILCAYKSYAFGRDEGIRQYNLIFPKLYLLFIKNLFKF